MMALLGMCVPMVPAIRMARIMSLMAPQVMAMLALVAVLPIAFATLSLCCGDRRVLPEGETQPSDVRKS